MTETLSISIENYLEAIFLLIQEHAVARSKDISERLKVNRSSVTGMLQTLRDRGLVNYERYGYVTLTPEGVKVASRVVRRHEALCDFMVHVLSIEKTEADVAACHMEHGISKHIVDRFVEFAEFVQTCPRAGAQWVHGLGYRCAESAASPQNCERCIEMGIQPKRGKEHEQDDKDEKRFAGRHHGPRTDGYGTGERRRGDRPDRQPRAAGQRLERE